MNKYGAIRSKSSTGRSFASKGERDCYLYLSFLEKEGEIDTIECQVTVPLTAGINLKVDFSYFDRNLSEKVYGEYKGFETPEWLLKKKLWRVHGPGRLRIYQGYNLSIRMVEEIIPKGEK